VRLVLYTVGVEVELGTFVVRVGGLVLDEQGEGHWEEEVDDSVEVSSLVAFALERRGGETYELGS
jgi:hypothetical protein